MLPIKYITIPDVTIFALRSDDITGIENVFLDYVNDGKRHGKSEVVVKVVFLDSDED